jgi:hypothetical protein
MTEQIRVKIEWNRDPSCEMEEILFDGKQVAYGNEWDVHGDDFLAGATTALDHAGIKYEVVENRDWKDPDFIEDDTGVDYDEDVEDVEGDFPADTVVPEDVSTSLFDDYPDDDEDEGQP